MFPNDIPIDVPLEPYSVMVDGNCVPHSGSVLAFGHLGLGTTRHIANWAHDKLGI